MKYFDNFDYFHLTLSKSSEDSLSVICSRRKNNIADLFVFVNKILTGFQRKKSEICIWRKNEEIMYKEY
jgi:hypothetical protein